MQLDDLLDYVNKVEASDLHLKVGRPPMIRMRGEVLEIPNLPPMTPWIRHTRLLTEYASG
jgi:Tfp pilus assembly pilus retraction ATPase PilT